jgi:putative FmdB family regulatory protein
MPTYEYRCPNGHDFDHFFRKISDGVAVWPCPVCGLPGERRMSGGAGLVFRGSGFYITDYGKDGKKDQRTAGAADSAKPAPAAGGGSEGGAGGSSGGGSGAPAGSPASSGGGSASSSTSSATSSSGSNSGSGAGSKPAGGTGKSRTTKSE